MLNSYWMENRNIDLRQTSSNNCRSLVRNTVVTNRNWMFHKNIGKSNNKLTLSTLQNS
uniref:Uncharacterized protein n=1 Tax=Rhizophagus irregularis (strain DAOM 181602 / DAOM 197198 / MUCL 43194) TaxID=747089 RepID=U9SKL8_RHIID